MIVVSDTTMWAADVPSMCTGMRGLLPVEVTLTGPVRDLHSGSFGGGVPNPLHAMASLLAGLHDEQGRVTLPRFYDRVLPLSGQERDLLARLPFDEKHWLADAGESGAAYGEQGFSTLERIWARPTAEVNGMWGGHTGPGPKTIIPRAAHAKISFRLVADQDPADVAGAFREYVAARTPDGLAATVSVQPAVRPCHSPITSPAVQAGRRAMQRAFGREVLFTKEGGSGPEADLAEILAAPLVFVAVGLDSDQIHAPNESVDLSLLLRGRRGVGIPVGRASRRGPQVTPLESLALARGTVDRVTHRRNDKEWLDAAWADPRTRVLVVSDGRALARLDDEHAELIFVSPPEAPAGTRFLLGQDADGGGVFRGIRGPAAAPPPLQPAPPGPPRCARWGRCSATATRACSRTRWRWPTGTTRIRTARSTGLPPCPTPAGTRPGAQPTAPSTSRAPIPR